MFLEIQTMIRMVNLEQLAPSKLQRGGLGGALLELLFQFPSLRFIDITHSYFSSVSLSKLAGRKRDIKGNHTMGQFGDRTTDSCRCSGDQNHLALQFLEFQIIKKVV